MTIDLLLSLIGFAFVMSITPGPNNVMLLASGLNWGFARTTPHMLGVTLGFPAMLAVVGSAMTVVMEAIARVRPALEVASAAYMLWLAWGIAAARPPAEEGDHSGTGRPMSFLEAAAFQWLNPKAWAIAFAWMGAYTVPAAPWPSLLVGALVFVAVGLPSVAVWAGLGLGLRRLIGSPRLLRAVNIAMGLLLVASLWPLLRRAV
jgi:threonine/homoserine/homoserine lactone efflux protein